MACGNEMQMKAKESFKMEKLKYAPKVSVNLKFIRLQFEVGDTL